MSNRSASSGTSDQSVARPDARPEGSQSGAPAPYTKRLVALVIDWVGCLLIGGAIASVAGLPSSIVQHGFAAYPILIIEYGVFVGLFGQTAGMRLTRLHCVRYDGPGTIGVPRGLLRGILLCLVVPALLIGQGGRGLHDRAAASIVVQD